MALRNLLVGFLLLIFLQSNAFGQAIEVNTELVAKIGAIPDSVTYTTTSIAAFINKNFTSPEEKLLAIYIWVANNIAYDVNYNRKFVLPPNEDDITVNVLFSRRAI